MTVHTMIFILSILSILCIAYIVYEPDDTITDAYGRRLRIVKHCYEGSCWWVIEYESEFGAWHHFVDYKYYDDEPVPCNDTFNSEQEARDFLKKHVKWVDEQKNEQKK